MYVLALIAGSLVLCVVRSPYCRTIDSLYEQLVGDGVVVRAAKTQMTEYLGEYRYVCPA